MRHPYFYKAVISNYEQLLPAGEMPHYFLHIQVDPSTIDVNIHPTKTEIKFENEQPIWQILSAAVRETLGKSNAVPTIDFDTEGAPEIPILHHGQQVEPPRVSYSPITIRLRRLLQNPRIIRIESITIGLSFIKIFNRRKLCL